LKKRPVLLIVIALNLLVLVALAFAYPHLMVSPGPLVQGHAELATDCFACHAPWRGASSARCTGCHAVADVGLKTTQGVPIAAGTIKGSFHQSLIEQDCMACHSDHQGPRLTKRSRKPFSHGLLQVAVRENCASCHAAPQDTLHRGVKTECSTCHGSKAWKPATFDHGQHFVLDRDHEAPCETCHKNNDHSRYTCYGCHEHSVAKIRQEHVEEGIRDFENCVECHRDPRVEPEKPGGRERERRKKD
jgi:Class III cytochrome C family